MKVIYTDTHRLHRPEYQFVGGRRKAHADVPARADSILAALRERGFGIMSPRDYHLDVIRTVHAGDYVDYLAGAYQAWVNDGRASAGVIPGTFPVRPIGRKPGTLSRQAGYYCLDTETVITEHTFRAALAAACCALTAADLVLEGEGDAYALCRPPGHHAGRDYCGGYCYLNNAALAATRLCDARRCKVAVLDVDCHHGNGTQSIFYESNAVLYASIHAEPDAAYPYYWGFADETGAGEGVGFNLNLPLPPGADEATYLDAVDRALDAIGRFSPVYLVVSLGTDASADDRLGALMLPEGVFGEMGRRVAEVGLPTLVVQEGGYDVAGIGRCVGNFLEAVSAGGADLKKR